MSDRYYVLSAPDYTLGSHNSGLIRNHLANSCCRSCIDLHLDEFGLPPQTISDYLWTPCGAEYGVDEFESWEEYVKWFKEVL
mgnify:CR=1 FL=1